ncbi:MAG: hypothetical protein QM785_00735 [Pyrinomonadaceae bacterium]
MTLKAHCLLLLIVCFFATGPAISQDVKAEVSFQISFAGGKTAYRIGEPVKLILAYTSAHPGYVVETYYSPRFDDVILSPKSGVYDWLYSLNRLYSYDDVSSVQQLSLSPASVEITLNDLVRFDRPGKYKLAVVSRRVSKAKEDVPFRSNAIPLRSNEIELEIKEMSEAEEQAEVKRIAALMDSATTLPQHSKFKRELDYLTGDASTVEKVSRFIKPPVFGGVTWLDTGTGLNIARNKKLAIELLEAAFRDLDREPGQDLIGRLVTLRMLMEDEQRPSQAADSQQLANERRQRALELRQGYDAELVESLKKRSGRTRTGTALRIFTSLPKDDLSSDAYNATRPLVLEKFDELKHYEQSELLDRFWEKIKSPSLVTSLEKILAGKEPEPVWSNRANSFKRLIELDQNRARPLVIKEIRDPNSFINPDILKGLDDKYLPEVDDALIEHINRLTTTNAGQVHLNLEFKLMLAARYATAKIYDDMLRVYTKYGINWRLEQSGSILAYLLSHNEKEGIPLVEDRLVKSHEESGFNVFYNLTRISMPPGLQKILRKRLESEEPETLGTAAYYLSKFGGQENRNLIENRHERWLKKWSGRSAELDDPKADDKTKAQSMAQINLLISLIRTESWKLSDKEAYQLKLMCVSRACRETFGIK